MTRNSNSSVTPEEIVGSILEEMQSSILAGWYFDFVPNVFRVYLYREDLERLRGLETPIREQAARALDEELAKLNKPPRTLPFLPAAPKKQARALGSWSIEFLENSDEDAGRNRLIVKCTPPVVTGQEQLDGPATVRVNASPVPMDDGAKTQRTSYGGPPASEGESHARLVFEDDTGKHTYEMTKDLIKIGRGGVDYLVDIQLLTKPDVGREHLQIRRDAKTGKFLIKDLSKFGTWMNGEQVASSVSVENGVPRDRNIEVEMPSKARLNLANVVQIEFKKLR